jgi:Flp pilus assembly protein TadG
MPVISKTTDGQIPVAAWRLDCKGGIAINLAMLFPVLCLAFGSAVNYGITLNQKDRLQQAADAASLAAAKELSLANAKTENVQAVVTALVKQYISSNHESPFKGGSVEATTRVSTTPLEIEVTATQTIDLPFNVGFGSTVEKLAVQSTARIVGKPNICVLGLDPSAGGTISLEQKARVTGTDCAVFSNSSHTNSIKAKNSASLTASFICSRGGKDGGPGSFSPEPITDCPNFDDPLSGRPEPVSGSCTEKSLVIKAATRMLSPGTYCGGLQITSGANVKLEPGVYIFKDGQLKVDGGSSLSGENTGLFFTGAGANLEFAPDSHIQLTAPSGGEMAGLLVFASRSQPDNLSFRIMSDDARTLLGTIYIPNGELRVDANSPVADKSAYTAIVARTMRLYGGPHLVLNTNYNLTSIPVPEGIKGAGEPAVLVK